MVIFSTASFILDSIPQVAWLHPFLITHHWLAFGDLLRVPIAWDGDRSRASTSPWPTRGVLARRVGPLRRQGRHQLIGARSPFPETFTRATGSGRRMADREHTGDPPVSGFIDSVLSSVPGWVVYLAVFGLPFLEAAVLLGFVVPGEAAVVFGGVVAGRGDLSLTLVLVVAIAGAILGDSVGYVVGRRYGQRIQATRLGRRVGEDRWSRAEDFLRRRGPVAVFVGRFTALLRAMVPGAAGMARMPYRTFLVFNVLGGAVWASARGSAAGRSAR